MNKSIQTKYPGGLLIEEKDLGFQIVCVVNVPFFLDWTPEVALTHRLMGSSDGKILTK